MGPCPDHTNHINVLSFFREVRMKKHIFATTIYYKHIGGFSDLLVPGHNIEYVAGPEEYQKKLYKPNAASKPNNSIGN